MFPLLICWFICFNCDNISSSRLYSAVVSSSSWHVLQHLLTEHRCCRKTFSLQSWWCFLFVFTAVEGLEILLGGGNSMTLWFLKTSQSPTGKNRIKVSRLSTLHSSWKAYMPDIQFFYHLISSLWGWNKQSSFCLPLLFAFVLSPSLSWYSHFFLSALVTLWVQA